MDAPPLNAFDVAATLVVLAAVFGFINYRFIGLPHTIGLTIMGALASLAVVVGDVLVPGAGFGHEVRLFLESIDFRTALMDGMLSFLLFAGALHVDLAVLLERKWAVLFMASLGVIISTLIVGFAFKFLGDTLGLGIPLIWCLVFGALISPTDPVAVLGILKSARVPESLEAKVAGESLFNDGVGVVVFSILLAAALGGGELSPLDALEMFAVEALGGGVLGLAVGWLGFLAMRHINEHNLEVLITLAIVMGGYAAAHAFHLSGPVAMAVAGLLIGNHGVALAMSETTREHVNQFWSLIDEILNSVLFLLIGLEVVAVVAEPALLGAGLISIVIVLLARVGAVAVPMLVLRFVRPFTRGAFPILVWGGLRGGISVALALSLPAGPLRDSILTVTYVVVLFSVIVQGASVGWAARRFVGSPADLEESEAQH